MDDAEFKQLEKRIQSLNRLAFWCGVATLVFAIASLALIVIGAVT